MAPCLANFAAGLVFYRQSELWPVYAAAVAAIATSALLIVIYRIREKRWRGLLYSQRNCRLIDPGGDFGRGENLYQNPAQPVFRRFAAVLLGGVLRGRAMMKVFFKAQFDLPDRVWNSLSLRWGLFFLPPGWPMKWRGAHFSDDDWVLFRVVVMAPATGLFMLAQLPLTFRGMREFKATQKGDIAA